MLIERLPEPLHEAISRLLRNISLPVAVGPEEPSSLDREAANHDQFPLTARLSCLSREIGNHDLSASKAVAALIDSAAA